MIPHLRKLLFVLSLAVMPMAGAANFTTIDSFAYKNQAEAERTWRAVGNSPRVVQDAKGLVLPCPFQEDRDRVYWDRDVNLNLADYSSLEFDLACDQPEALRSFALYLKSGEGWYVWNRPLRSAGRHRLILPRGDFSTEGKPAGWNHVDRLRISPWKGAPVAACLSLYSFTARKDTLFIVRATTSTQDAGERAMSQRLADRISRWLTNVGVSHAVVSEDDVSRGKLSNARLVVLPLNPHPPAAVLSELRGVIERGGHLVVCFSSSAELADLMNVELGAYTPAAKPGRWEAMDFADAEKWHVPPRVYQSSWNIRPVKPRAGAGRVLARWVDATGNVLPDPAWVATDRGLWMTHVLLEDDTFSKQRMLLGLLAHFEKTLWYEAARNALADVGKIDSFTGVEGAVAGIRKLARGDQEIADQLAQARELRGQMTGEFNRGNYAGAVDLNEEIRELLTAAYARCQNPRRGELRGIWDHDGTGWFPGDWDKTCRIMAQSGFNTVFPNMQWAGLAHYKSDVIPTSDTFRRYGDQVTACVKAAHKYGMQVHVWKVCWNVEQAPDEYVARLKKSGRLLKSASGATLPWLNPAIADNQTLELDAIKELVRNYDIDGLHLDYIRYPPAAAEKSAWAISEFVRKVNAEVKALRPDLKLSAAVWGQYPSCVKSVGQDWAAWLKGGYVDFVVPMNYTADRYEFESLLRRQLALPNAKGRILAGIGVTSAESQLRPDEAMEQVLTLRALDVPGFVLFDMSHPVLDATLPMLRLGLTKP